MGGLRMKKVYPAVFYPEEEGYSVDFPDLPGCFTQGDDLADAISMAEEALGLYLAVRYDEGLEVLPPSDVSSVNPECGFVNYIASDPSKYRKNGKSIKKTLTIPEWLNTEAEKSGINFSAVLAEALITRLGV
jgi:predicted RNase H-like HicB family nuclease